MSWESTFAAIVAVAMAMRFLASLAPGAKPVGCAMAA